MGDLFAAGGKRLRPALLLLCAQAGAYDLGLVMPAAMAVEFTHAATLVHDDVIDNSSTRRGRPSVLTRHGPAAAIVVADYYFAKAYEEASVTGSVEVVAVLAGAVMSICQGELAQQASRYLFRTTPEDYMRRIEMKTASLLAASCRIGAHLGGLDQAAQQALTLFGLELGLAFQVVDDVLDYTGSDAEVGKPVGQDLAEGNATLPLLLAFEEPLVAARLDELLDEGRPPSAEALQQALMAVRGSAGPTRAIERAVEIALGAKRQLEAAPPGPSKQALDRLADYVVRRRL